MMLRHDLRTDVHICGKFASQASLFVHHGRDVNIVYCCIQMKTFRSVWLLRNLTLDGKLCLRDEKKSCENVPICARINSKPFVIG